MVLFRTIIARMRTRHKSTTSANRGISVAPVSWSINYIFADLNFFDTATESAVKCPLSSASLPRLDVSNPANSSSITVNDEQPRPLSDRLGPIFRSANTRDSGGCSRRSRSDVTASNGRPREIAPAMN